MYRQDFRVLLLYHLCSLCSLPLEESQVLGGGGWQAGGTQTCCRHPAAEEQSRERRLCQLSAFCRAGRAHLLHPTPPRVSAISQYSFAPEEHLTENSATFAYTQGSYFSVDSQGYDFCTVSLYNPPSILNPENLP